MSSIKLIDVCKTYRTIRPSGITTKNVLSDFNLEIKQNDFIVLAGASGIGKSTILNIIANILKPDSGMVLYNEKTINAIKNYRPSVVGFMPCYDTLINSLTVLENMRLACDIAKSNNEVVNDIDHILQMLDDVKLRYIIDSFPLELSSGEYKRVCLGRVLLQNSPFMLFDEPTSNLDRENVEIILNIFKSDIFNDHGCLLATHDPRLIDIGKERGKVIEL